jgi:hypothetical protein
MANQKDLKIVECEITGMPNDMFDPMPQVRVRFEGSAADDFVTLFSYFPDELEFSTSEFINLTRTQAMRLYSDRDVAYLKS